jgi:hypothetical protein
MSPHEGPQSSDLPVGHRLADEPKRVLSPWAGRAAGRLLYGALVAFDVVFLLATISDPTLWRWAVLVLVVAVQLAFVGFDRRTPSR